MPTKNELAIGAQLKKALNRDAKQAGESAGREFVGRRGDDKSFILQVDRIRRDPDQVRQTQKEADDADVQALAASISSDGLRAAPEVRWLEADDTYEIVTGERRFAAMTEILGWEEIPVRIVDATDDEILWLQLHENIHRQALTPMELAVAVQKASDEGLSISQIAEKLHKSKTYVQKALTVAQKLSKEAQATLASSETGKSLEAVYAVATVAKEHQSEVAQRIIKENLSQRDILQVTGEVKAQTTTDTSRGGRPASSKPYKQVIKLGDVTVTVQSKRSHLDRNEVRFALLEAEKKI